MFFFNKKQANTSINDSAKDRYTKPSNLVVTYLAILSLPLLSACGGSGEPNANNTNTDPDTNITVAASPDTVSTQQETPVNIAVLANDTGVSGTPELSIEVAPSNGSATIMANNTINYTPSTAFTGKESFSYKVKIDDNVSIATVTIDVSCTSCSKEVTINLAWQPATNGTDIGYLVYYGNDTNNINTLAIDLSSQTGLNPTAPKVAFSSQSDLSLNQGDRVCFQISAYTSNAQSNFSEPVCGTI